MFDEITYALLNGKIKKLEDNAGGMGGMPIIDLQSVPGTAEHPMFLGEEQEKAVQEAIAAGQSIVGIHYMTMLDGTIMPGPTVFVPWEGALVG